MAASSPERSLAGTDLEKPFDESAANIADSVNSAHDLDTPGIPDGGLAAWSAVFGGWCVLFTSFGWVDCIGIFQSHYQTDQLRDYTPSTIAWITSVEVCIKVLALSQSLEDPFGEYEQWNEPLADNKGLTRRAWCTSPLHFSAKYTTIMALHLCCTGVRPHTYWGSWWPPWRVNTTSFSSRSPCAVHLARQRFSMPATTSSAHGFYATERWRLELWRRERVWADFYCRMLPQSFPSHLRRSEVLRPEGILLCWLGTKNHGHTSAPRSRLWVDDANLRFRIFICIVPCHGHCQGSHTSEAQAVGVESFCSAVAWAPLSAQRHRQLLLLLGSFCAIQLHHPLGWI